MPLHHPITPPSSKRKTPTHRYRAVSTPTTPTSTKPRPNSKPTTADILCKAARAASSSSDSGGGVMVTDPQTLEDYGFGRCIFGADKIALLGVYRTLVTNLGVTAADLHGWMTRGRRTLGANVVAAMRAGRGVVPDIHSDFVMENRHVWDLEDEVGGLLSPAPSSQESSQESSVVVALEGAAKNRIEGEENGDETSASLVGGTSSSSPSTAEKSKTGGKKRARPSAKATIVKTKKSGAGIPRLRKYSAKKRSRLVRDEEKREEPESDSDESPRPSRKKSKLA